MHCKDYNIKCAKSRIVYVFIDKRDNRCTEGCRCHLGNNFNNEKYNVKLKKY